MPAGNVHPSWRRSTIPAIFTSTWSARSARTIGRGAGGVDRRRGLVHLAARGRGHRLGDHRGGCAGWELLRAEGDHRWAFGTYETLLHPFLRGKQSSAERFIGFFATRTRFGLWFRNLAMRTMNFGPLATVLAGGVRDNFELPEYGI